MMARTIALTTLVAVLIVAAPVTAHEAPVRHVHAGSTMAPNSESFDAVWYQDIPYATAPNTDPLLLSLDVYTLDPAPAGVPVMVYVHGGGGRRGDKAWPNDIASKPAHFIQRERFVFVSVNYRLGDAGQYPVAHQDVANALAWVHDNIARYGGDPNRIFLSGHSSGAALVARVSTMDMFLENAGKNLTLIKGAITIDGGNFDARTGPSPVQSVARGKYVPPLLLLHIGNGGGSEKDALAMATAMRAAGHRADVVDLIGKDHFSASSDIGRYNDATTIAVHRFLASLTGTSESRAAR
jgi:acetyl esterase/lipase